MYQKHGIQTLETLLSNLATAPPETVRVAEVVLTRALANTEDIPTEYAEYNDTHCPPGYLTNYAFHSMVYPKEFDYLYDPVEGLAVDHDDLRRLTETNGKTVVTVEAPSALKRVGIMTVPAFPITILDRFYS